MCCVCECYAYLSFCLLKEKASDDMGIRDWRSDVCSSELRGDRGTEPGAALDFSGDDLDGDGAGDLAGGGAAHAVGDHPQAEVFTHGEAALVVAAHPPDVPPIAKPGRHRRRCRPAARVDIAIMQHRLPLPSRAPPARMSTSL